MLLRWILLVIGITIYYPIESQEEVRQNPNGSVHEAFISPIHNAIIFQAIDSRPPTPIQEKSSVPSDPKAIWIPGYWEYDYNKDQFYWVSGIWRRSPPGKYWLDGFWKQFSEGWVRIPGSWTPVTKQAITYLAAAPPETFEEDPLKTPENSFWVSGGWVFNNVIQDYSWRKGRWTSFDPKWIFVPATYVWREEGYVYIPAYWDWPLETRGTLYQSVLIAPEDRPHIIYTPTEKVSATDLIQKLIYSNPDYMTLLTQYLHSHPDQKNKLIGIPSWWSWGPWTTFTWAHQWNLWWWFTHPLFPPPVWINITHAQGILPPSAKLLEGMKQVRTPFIIAPQGVITPTLLYDNFKTLTGKGEPLSKTQPIVLPVSSRLIDSIKEVAGSKIQQSSKLFSPSGIPVDIKPLPKPTFFLNEAQRKSLDAASLQEVPPTPQLK